MGRVVPEKYQYLVELPTLSPSEMKLFRRVREAVSSLSERGMQGLSHEQRRQVLFFHVLETIDQLSEQEMEPEKKHRLAGLIVSDIAGYGLLDFLLEDEGIEEVMVIGPRRPVYVFHRKHGMLETNIVFSSAEEIERIAKRIARNAGREINEHSPLLDARLSDGSRANATLSPPAVDGPTITIRKFLSRPLSIVDLLRYNTLTPDAAAFLWLMIEGGGAWAKNLLIAGGAGSGKTTTLNALCSFIPDRERVITIEDTAELQLPVRHVVRFEVRPPAAGMEEIDMDTLLKNCLRMRPDRIIIGEVRGKEAMTLFTAMNTGHGGSLATLHANSARECITRLSSAPMNVPANMLAALDIIIMQARIPREGATIRRVTEITEVRRSSESGVAMNTLYKWDPVRDSLNSTGTPSALLQELARQLGVQLRELTQELERRKLLLEYLMQRDVRDMKSVREWIERYLADPDSVLESIASGLRSRS